MKGFFFVQAERLELSHLAALDPKSSVSTNSTTPAIFTYFDSLSKWDANINNTLNIQITLNKKKYLHFCIFEPN